MGKSIGKYTIITNNTPLSDRGGYYCNVCECSLKDSSTYLDHINGRKHQRRLGMNMRPVRSTLSEVRKRFEYHKKRKDQRESGTHVAARLARFEEELRRKRQK